MLTYSDIRQAHLPGPTYVTLGNFDGLHLGHQALLIRAQELAAAHSSGHALCAIVTFDPHPLSVLRPERTLQQLTSPDDRLRLAASLGVEIGVIHPFTRETAIQEAYDFVQMLKQHLGLAGLVVGPDFALGRNRGGTIETLRRFGADLEFTVDVVEPVLWSGEAARSSTIRDRIVAGDVAGAAALLGRPYVVAGPVREGDKRGRTIGIPTANIAPPTDRLLPADGVYATRARICLPWQAYAFASVTNIGYRPTVDGLHHRVEAHLLDFPPPELLDDLYGQVVTLEFIERLRGEQRFAGVDALVAQIREDIAHAVPILKS